MKAVSMPTVRVDLVKQQCKAASPEDEYAWSLSPSTSGGWGRGKGSQQGTVKEDTARGRKAMRVPGCGRACSREPTRVHADYGMEGREGDLSEASQLRAEWSGEER